MENTVQPFQKQAKHINAGTVSIEQSRAVAEALGKIQVAKQFPRSPSMAFEQIVETCKRQSMARSAIYAYPRAGQTISGPSIRLAEELARAIGNIEFGIRELSQREGESEMQAYAWDLETNVVSIKTFTVKHERHTKTGITKLTDPRDIYEINANQGGRRLRACILAIIPPDLVEEALEQCRKTLAGDTAKPLSDRVKAMVNSFAPYGVTVKHIEQKIGCKLDDVMVDQLTDLISIFNSLKDGMSKPSDWFGIAQSESKETTAEMEQLNKPASSAAPTPAPAPAPAPKTKAKKETQVVEDVEAEMMPPETDVAPGADGNLF
jgi:hypothetical protein